jgi:hypothetical protein
MKWTKELDNELIELIKNGKNYNEAAVIMNTIPGSIRNRAGRLKLKLQVPYKAEYTCLYCKKKFVAYIKRECKFCDHHCSASYTNLGRKHSDETKQKIGQKSIGGMTGQIRARGEAAHNWNPNAKYKLERERRNQPKKCKICQNLNLIKTQKLICDTCRAEYYSVYRPSCEFDFDINLYQEKFDFELVKKYGWYSPSNKGNNLNGVSRDHMYSVKDGFTNKIDFNIIKHPANCKLMRHVDNNLKKTNSSITLNELLKRIEVWDA